jgi:hypothetical protein
MPVTSTSSRFCQRDSSMPVDRRRVISQEPTVRIAITSQVKAMVALSSNPATRQSTI